MSKVSEFYDALAKDQAMQERAKTLNSDNSLEEEAALTDIVTFAAKEGYSFTTEEARAYITEKSKGELKDDQLESVAGGAVCVIVGAGKGRCRCLLVGADKSGGCICVIGGGA